MCKTRPFQLNSMGFRACHVLALAIPVLLSACVTTGSNQSADADRWVPIQPSSALNAQPAGPAEIVSVRERRRGGTELVQHITLANDTYLAGENSLSLAIEWAGPFLKLTRTGESLGQYELKGQVLEAALEQALPDNGAGKGGGANQLNRYGPYSYVSAAYPDGAQCVFAWQEIDGAKVGKSVDRAAAQLRNCRQDGDLARLLAPMGGLSLAALDTSASTQTTKAD
jgi:hypothetical protein